ncbi:MAG: response regulator, partial [Bryobacteraceae bacterium]
MKTRILVIEDEEKLRRVLELHLRSTGYEAETAGSAGEGWKLADRADLIVTDLRLPDFDGLEFISRLRRQNTRTPVIVITAYGTVETAVEAMRCGADDFILKPFSL